MKNFKEYLNENSEDQPIMKIAHNGTKQWILNNQFHRLDGPAIETLDGTKQWYQYDQLHRLDGPAIEQSDGTKYFYQYGKCHRLDGPAIEYSNGEKVWYQNDQLHRTDGPAVERPDGTKKWYYKDKEIDLNINIPLKLQIVMIKNDPENISKIANPDKKIIEYLTNEHPWALTDQIFSRCKKDCRDLKSQWLKIGKARKQIGL